MKDLLARLANTKEVAFFQFFDELCFKRTQLGERIT